MKNRRCGMSGLVAAAGVLALVVATCAAEPATNAAMPSDASPLLTALDNRLTIGTRSTWFWLEDHTRNAAATSVSQGSFYGSITELKAKQDPWPVKLFADYLFCPYGGLELTWEQVEADTITRLDGHNDGTLIARTPLLSVFGQYPNETPVVPFAGVGVGYAVTSFTADYHWTHGFDSVTGEFKGGPYWHQQFDTDNAWCWFAYAGAAVTLAQHWSLDLYVRHLGLDVKGTHSTFVGDYLTSQSSFSFPLRNDAVGVGVRYAF